jgi:signal transduction histidine kinase
MKHDPYTPNLMEAARSGAHGDSRFDGLRAEAAAAVGSSANALRAVRERYRDAYADVVTRWQGLRDQLDVIDHRARERKDPTDDDSQANRAAAAAEVAADGVDGPRLRAEVSHLTVELTDRQSELTDLELAQEMLERTWRSLERRGDGLIVGAGGPPPSGSLAMQIVDAQEAERARLAQEIHDGPAQALTNAIFQVEYIERVIPGDPRLAQTELRFLRELLRRELGDLRSFISQLRPHLLDELGLDGAITDVVDHMRTVTGLTIVTELAAPAGTLKGSAETVALRVTQEALQNVRKHASATHATVRTMMRDDGWVLEVDDDGRGFDVEAVSARGKRNFGLRFMQERAELIGARLDIRSRPDGGTVVQLTIPIDAVTGAEEST